MLHHLRQARHITRFMLVWFALSLGAAIASPLVNPQSTLLICSASGVMKVLVKNADGSSTEPASRTLDCPLCATTSAPPSVIKIAALPAQPVFPVLQPIPVAQHVARTAAPSMAHAPPAFS